MKKLAYILLIGLMVLASACSTATQAPLTTSAPEEAASATTAPQATKIIAVSLPALDNPLMLAFQDAFKNTFG
jgi:ABC-type sugar transport system substrate-binding protein